MRRLILVLILLVLAPSVATAAAVQRHLNVILIPADGGTEAGTKADYQPLFNAISRTSGLKFEIRVGQSYGAVVEALCNGTADIAFVGPVTYIQANKRRCAELLAVAVEKGQSIYYAGLFAKADSPIKSVKGLKGARVAFGDVNSTSSFVYPMAMILDAGLDPVRDLKDVRMTGSHANSLAALTQGQVDVAALSFDSFDKAVRQGAVKADSVKVVARSDAIPYPPIIMNARLAAPLKARLKLAFKSVHQAPGVTPDMIRGYGGGKVDRYDSDFPAAKFNVAAKKMSRLTEELKGEILKKSAQR
ncbi:phosphate/phosphite/phosphonate ABC transporter substrate-binding protein [Caulobacter sp. DWR1-3-2b1]|uniref:phosphate/phosphite/phosphonate ABC transporter substrate-binding protein n=1 Tax=Caulobacter sp. DWR1-3-2b1 TaxID=2804670 RepID=UPI003CF629DE